MSQADSILQRLTTLYPRAIDLSLDRIRHLLRRLGDPQERLPPVIHVAGTNGKGSTVAIMRACLEAAGYRVHVYTSPHLVRFNERIRLAGTLIADAALTDLLEEIERVNDGTPITFFEITTTAAFLAFASCPADVVLLETGLGGRLDATNVVAAPAVAAITPVSMDHMDYLGDQIEAIAAEKAGILKPGRPAVLGPQSLQAAAVIEARARAIAAPLIRHGTEWHTSAAEQGWRFTGQRRILDLPLPSLPGSHQIANAGTALACLEALDGFALPDLALRRGVIETAWPARLQCLTFGPLFGLLPRGWELWLDGAHNAAGAAALADFVAGWRDRPTHLVLGALTNRDCLELLRPFANRVASIVGVPVPDGHSSHKPEDIAAAAMALGIAAATAGSPAEAVRGLTHAGIGPARILICGSLYLAGAVLAENH